MLTDQHPVNLEEELATLKRDFKEREELYLKANGVTFGLSLVGIIVATALYNYLHFMMPPCRC